MDLHTGSITWQWISYYSFEPRVSVPDFVSQLCKSWNGKPGFEANPTRHGDTRRKAIELTILGIYM